MADKNNDVGLLTAIKYQLENNLDLVLSTQKQLAEVTCPLLEGHYKNNRIRMGAISPIDRFVENSQMVSAVMYLKEHNYLAYLTINKEFALIREYFKKEDFSRELAIINEIEREEEREERRKSFFLHNQSTERLNQQKNGQHGNEKNQMPVVPVADYSNFFVEGLSNLDLYRYYAQEVHRITEAHYENQILTLDESLQGRTDRIKKAKSLMENEDYFEEDLKELDRLNKYYRDEREKIMSRNTMRLDGSRDLTARKEQYNDLLQLEQNFEKDFQKILSKHPKHEGLAALLKEDKEESKRIHSQLKQREQEFQQTMAELAPMLEQTFNAAKKDLSTNLNAIIADASSVVVEDLPIEHRQEVTNAMNQLKTLTSQINEAKDQEQLDQLLSRCGKEIEVIKQHVPQGMEPTVLKQFRIDTQMFQRLTGNNSTVASDLSNNVVQRHSAFHVETVGASPEISAPQIGRSSSSSPVTTDDLNLELPSSSVPHTTREEPQTFKSDLFKQELKKTQQENKDSIRIQVADVESISLITDAIPEMLEDAFVNGFDNEGEALSEQIQMQVLDMRLAIHSGFLSADKLNRLYDNIKNFPNDSQKKEDIMEKINLFMNASSKMEIQVTENEDQHSFRM